jgi:hypothetical protein
LLVVSSQKDYQQNYCSSCMLLALPNRLLLDGRKSGRSLLHIFLNCTDRSFSGPDTATVFPFKSDFFTTLLLISHLPLHISLLIMLLLSNQLHKTFFFEKLIAVQLVKKFPDFYSLPCSTAQTTTLS